MSAPPDTLLSGSPYQAYVYAYPHKTAYRAFEHPLPLAPLWQREDRSRLFLYVHVPFCTMRCGFCNLFTQAKPDPSLPNLYLETLQRQANAMQEVLQSFSFSRMAIGGGTPTYFNLQQLQELLKIIDTLGVKFHQVPCSVEISPDTIDSEKLQLFQQYGIERLSMGIQSFIEQETTDSGRPQPRAQLEQALQLLKQYKPPILNLDLIYGLPNQTVASWLYSLEQALSHEPEELFLYPLYVRPLTGLGRSRKQWDDVRRSCYREARARLLAAGYEQFSMRMFHKPRQRPNLVYCCQQDGMLGLGCGARSYTRELHYSWDYAVQPRGIKDIIRDYISREASEFGQAEYGFLLNDDEQRRRFVLQSILNTDGLQDFAYVQRFGTLPENDFQQLNMLQESHLLQYDAGTWKLTPQGLELSDAIGPWLFSKPVQQLMGEYESR